MFDWNPAHRETVLTLFVATTAYVAFHYGARSSDRGPGNAASVFRQRVWGFLLLGALPAVIVSLSRSDGLAQVGLGPGRPLRSLVWVVAATTLALPFVYASSRRPVSWEHYPEVRAPRWDRGLYLANGGTWVLYLLGYEFLFRGYLLLSLQRGLGTWPAVAVTTALYVFAHLPKHAGETLGTIPMGVVFAIAALDSGSIAAPIAIHAIIALSSDALIVRARAQAERS